MTVKELRQLLANEDDDTLIVLSSDSEGNQYSPAAACDLCVYHAENTWRGEIEHDDDEDDEWNEEGVKALVLWPTN